MQKHFKRSEYLLIIIIFFSFLFISYQNYQETRDIIVNKHNIRQSFIERRIIDTIKHADSAYRIIETELNQTMEEYSQELFAYYQNNPNIKTWPLEKFKEQFNGFDIYLINKDLKVIATTFKQDLGLDFSQYTIFANLLNQRIKGNTFHADRMDISTTTGKMTKYSYLPTEDNQYLIELSVNIKEKYPVIKEFNILALTEELTDSYQSIKQIAIYKFNEDGSRIGQLKQKAPGITAIDISENRRKLIQQTLQKNEQQSYEENKIEYKYAPYLTFTKNGEFDWWNSYVVEVIYDNHNMYTEIAKQRYSYFFNGFLFSVLIVAFFIMSLSYYKKNNFMVNYDFLTKLPNRKNFTETINKILAGKREADKKIAVLFLDLDNFKAINDKYGHSFGDQVLREIANRLSNSLRKEDLAARLGGDEFVILLKNMSNKREVERVKIKINESLAEPIKIKDKSLTIDASIGDSLHPLDGEDAEELIHHADHVMYQVKENKK